MKQISSLIFGIDADCQPEGYVRLAVNGRHAVACEWAAPAIRDLLADHTLHEWAAARIPHDLMRGRGINYGVVLPASAETGSTTPVVVRRNRHGGLLRFLTGEYFLPPSRAPLELSTSLRLTSSGVPTPEIIAYAIYPASGVFVRSDVVSRRLPNGADFPDAWCKADSSTREAILEGVATLLRALVKAGAWHADLNLKNIYIAETGSTITPYVLDVDRVTFPGCGDIAARNIKRLARSARKWRSRWGLDFDEKTLARLTALSQEMN